MLGLGSICCRFSFYLVVACVAKQANRAFNAHPIHSHASQLTTPFRGVEMFEEGVVYPERQFESDPL